ncbi:hypothetical protein D3C87_1777210 [compost metagenome]
MLSCLIPHWSVAKCIGFEYGNPNFCSKIKINKFLEKNENKCLYTAGILSLKPASPKYYDFVEYEKIVERQSNVVVQISSEQCDSFRDNHEYVGALMAKCHDNISYWELFRQWIGAPITKAQFDFGESLDVFYFKEGVVKTTCQ